jgi:hypothetical protein
MKTGSKEAIRGRTPPLRGFTNVLFSINPVT